MSKQEEIIEVCGKKVVVRYVEGLSPCPPCVFYEEGCTCFEYCRKFDRGGETAYFVEAEQPEADLDAEIFAWQKAHATEETKQIIAMTARHFAEWERKRTLDKVVEWMKKNLTYIHPRKGVETCMVNIPVFLDAMNEENT